MTITHEGILTAQALDEVFRIVRGCSELYRLRVWDDHVQKTFLFSGKGVRLYYSGGRRTDRVGEVLVRQGLLSPENRDELLSIAKAQGKTFGEQAAELSVLSQEEIDNALRIQMEAHLADLYFWEGARYEFQKGEAQDATPGARPEFVVFAEVSEIVEGVSLRHRRWQWVKHLIRSDLEIFVPTKLGREEGLSSGADRNATRVLALVDGQRRVRDIIRESGLLALTVYESLQTAYIEGRIDRAEESYLQVQTRREEILEDIRTLEADRRERPYDHATLARLADAYLAIGERDRAGQRWRELARLKIRNGQHEEALDLLRRASQSNPQNYEIREQILDVYSSLGRERRLVEEGCELGNLYFKLNLLNRARSLLGHLVYLAPGDARLRRLYALTLLGLGQKKLALWQLKELRRALESQDEPGAELADVYRQILVLDPTDQEVRKRLHTVGRRKKRLWPIRAAIAASALLLVSLSAVIYLDRNAETNFANRQLRIEGLLQELDFAGARNRVRELSGLVRDDAVRENLEELRALIEHRETEYLAVGIPCDFTLAERLERAGDVTGALELYGRVAQFDPALNPDIPLARKKRAELLASEERARALVESGNRHETAGDLEGAVADYREARKLYPDAESIRSLCLPVRIESVPPGAKVLLNGRAIEEPTPTVVQYSLRVPGRISIRKEGFEEAVLRVDRVLDARLTVPLQRKTRWLRRAEGPFEAEPVVAEGSLYVAGRDRLLHELSTGDGSTRSLCRLGIGGDTGQPVALFDGSVLVAEASGKVVSIEPRTGKLRWSMSTWSFTPCFFAADGKSGVAYVLRSDGILVALDASSGEVRWKTSRHLSTEIRPVLTPDGGICYASPTKLMVIKLRADDGQQIWSHSILPHPTALAAGPDGRIAAGCEDGSIALLHGDTGAELHRYRLSDRVVGRIDFREDALVAGTSDGRLHLLRPDGEGELWSARLPGGTPSRTLLTPEAVYAATDDGRVAAFDCETGGIAWLHRCETGVAGLAADGDLLFVTTLGGEVRAVVR